MSDAVTAVVGANAGFYRAFEALDLDAMDAVWAHDDDVKCVHPGWPLLTGWDAVRESWRAIFANTEEMRFTIGDLHVAVRGEVGWVTCTENILSDMGGRVGVTAILATNLFVRGADGWRMIHHHASHVLAASEIGEA
jgi:ketosteroid isomerase-like protein